MHRGRGLATMIEGLAALLGMSSVSLLHSLLPTHWLPFSVVGRAHGWSLSKTLLISACAPLTTSAAPAPVQPRRGGPNDHAAGAPAPLQGGGVADNDLTLCHPLTETPTTTSATSPLRVLPRCTKHGGSALLLPLACMQLSMRSRIRRCSGIRLRFGLR